MLCKIWLPGELDRTMQELPQVLCQGFNYKAFYLHYQIHMQFKTQLSEKLDSWPESRDVFLLV